MSRESYTERSKRRFQHVKQRIKERYGEKINIFLYKCMLNTIRSGGAFLVGVRDRGIHLVYLKIPKRKVYIYVVYDSREGQLLTALPPEDFFLKRWLAGEE